MITTNQFTISAIYDGGALYSTPYYLASDKSEGVTINDSGWSRTAPLLTPEEKYLWVYYVNRNGIGNSEPEIIQVYGDIVNFVNSGEKAPAESVKIKINCFQEGEGIPSPDNVRPIVGRSKIRVYTSPIRPKHYGAVWDREHYQLTRTGDAADITTNVTNFKYSGSVNENYDNPFDDIYPWSECKLCNVDIPTYMTLSKGDDIKDCVVAWEDDDNFSYEHQYGVWKYRPRFWGASWDDDEGNRHFDISDQPCDGYVFYPEHIGGRWWGVKDTITVDGVSKTVILPKPDVVLSNVAISTIHTYAKNFNGTIDNIFTQDASFLMMIIEYASMNTRLSIGNGVSSLYRQSSDKFVADTTNGTIVKVSKSVASACVKNAIMDIGTSNGGMQIGRYYIVSTEIDSSDNTILNVTLDRAVSVTTSNMWSIHGLKNVADEDIGSKTGYLGSNSQSNCYYRGEVLWGNFWRYVLGAYRQGGTHHVWIVQNEDDANNYDALNINYHYDTGIVLSSTNGYIKELKYLKKRGILATPSFCALVGGNATNPIGDYMYTTTSTSNTVLLCGGSANNGAAVGVAYWNWSVTASYSNWSCAARPSLKTLEVV